MSVKLPNRAEWLNYHHLYYFYVIANQGGIAKASKVLNIGQSALSTQLKQLEDAIGKPLFERQKKRLLLSEAGQIALRYAKEVFALGNEMMEAIHDRLQNQRIHVQIGALDSVPKNFILEVIQKAYKLGNCSVTVLEGRGDELLRELKSHQLDLIISNYPPSAEREGVFAKSVGKLDVVVCGSEKFKTLRKGFPKSLEGQPFVLPTQHSKLRQDLDHFFDVNTLNIDVVAETQDTSIQKILGANGVGLIPLSEGAADDMVKEKKLHIIGTLKNVHEEIWLISAARRVENPIAALLMKIY